MNPYVVIAGTVIGGLVGGLVMAHIRYRKMMKSIDKIEKDNKEMVKWLKATGVLKQ